jgi:hypothetical protein
VGGVSPSQRRALVALFREHFRGRLRSTRRPCYGIARRAGDRLARVLEARELVLAEAG